MAATYEPRNLRTVKIPHRPWYRLLRWTAMVDVYRDDEKHALVRSRQYVTKRGARLALNRILATAQIYCYEQEWREDQGGES